ncbi:MAG: hypothetical protein V3V31_12480 [Methylococcales bacterium]
MGLIHRGLNRSAVFILLISTAISVKSADFSNYGEFTGFTAIDLRLFPESPRFNEQDKDILFPSLVMQPEYRFEWNGGNDRLTLIPFFRLDPIDEERQHFDLRELNWIHLEPSWDIRIGLGVVFWGVTESRHLVNIINQTDTLEDIDEEDKLGQPMINLNLVRNWGNLEFFLLPKFRQRTFPNRYGRLRAPIPIDTDNAMYESAAKSNHLDFAGRWSHVIGDWDIGLAHFVGTSREPRLVPHSNEIGQRIHLVPHYDIINQTSIDVQATKGNWLWKLEAISRAGHDRRFQAVVTGFEYTFYGTANTSIDAGIVAEYLWDDRSEEAPLTPFDNDIFIGSRLAFNDEQSTELLMGAFIDLSSGASIITVEGSRRMGDSWKLDLDARIFGNIPESDLSLSSLRNDSFLNIRLSYFF